MKSIEKLMFIYCLTNIWYRFAHAFLFDSGSSCGEVIGHNKAINSVSIRLCRPLRAATASDDFTVNFYSGTPYKFSKSLKNHSRFVQCVQFSPDGSKFATCGSDGKIFMYDGENGDLIKEFVDKELKSSAHASGVLALCWSPDSSKLASSSMDHSTKIWNVETGNISIQNKISFTQKTIQDNQLVSNAWTGMGVLVLSLSGAYAIFDPVSGEQKLLFEGHQKGISCLGLNIQGSIVSASYDGAICLWNDYFQASLLTKTGQNIPENQIDSIIAGQDGEVLAASHLSFTGFAISSDISCEKREWLGRLSLARVNENIVALAENGIEVLSNVGEKLAEFTNFKSKPLTLAAHESMIAVGLQDKTICLFEYADFKLNYLKDHELSANFGAISALAFSPEGTKLAAGDDQRRLKIYDTKTFEVCKNNWCYHNAKISSVAWLSEDLVVSGSLDNSIMMWTPSSPIKPVATISNAHTGPIVSLLGLEAGRFVSASQDGSMKIWKLVKSE